MFHIFMKKVTDIEIVVYKYYVYQMFIKINEFFIMEKKKLRRLQMKKVKRKIFEETNYQSTSLELIS